jgi:hypothetical protein
MNHPHFTIPVLMFKYKDGTANVAGYSLEEGKEVASNTTDSQGRLFYHKVTRILSRRKSKGNFKSFDVPEVINCILSAPFIG